MNSLIYDLSGGSYHYNSDYSGPGATINVTAVEQVDLSLTKTDSVDPVTAGNNLTYTLTATNAGPSVAHNVSITDAVPAGTSFVSASGGGTLAAGTVTWSIGDLAPGANVSRTLTVHVNAGSDRSAVQHRLGHHHDDGHQRRQQLGHPRPPRSRPRPTCRSPRRTRRTRSRSATT